MRVNEEKLESMELVCPKRPWVLTTLSDDEACPDSESVSAVLSLHLSQCSTCKALAYQLTGLSSELRRLADLEPATALFAQADQQAHQALTDGARLTGRVDIPDEPLVTSPARVIRRWWTYGRFAAAAVILLAVGGYFSFFRAPKPSSYLPVVQPVADAASRPINRAVPGKRPPGPDTALVETTAAETPSDVGGENNDSSAPVICYHQTHQEAAKCEKTNVVHRIRPMGRRLPRRPGLEPLPRAGMNTIDKSEANRSNKGRKRD